MLFRSQDTGSQTPKPLKPAAVESLLAIRGSVIHDLRKQAKRVRYQMNLFTELYSPTYKDYVEDMKQIQGLLGDIPRQYGFRRILKLCLSLGPKT